MHSRNLSGTKTQQMIERMGSRFDKTKVVRPEWVIECIRQGKIVDEAPYLVIKSRVPSVNNYFNSLC